MSDNRWDELRQYQERKRQEQAAREQRLAEEQAYEKQVVEAEQKLREWYRRDSEQRLAAQRQLAMQQASDQQQRREVDRHSQFNQIAKELQVANQQREEALQEAHKRIAEIRAKRPDIPYDTFSEQFFHKRWRELYPDIELIPQFHIGPFRVDFCHEATKTVIELNGSIHAKRRVRNRDAPRHRYLESIGWHVLPFTNDETNISLDACIRETHATIVERQGRQGAVR